MKRHHTEEVMIAVKNMLVKNKNLRGKNKMDLSNEIKILEDYTFSITHVGEESFAISKVLAALRESVPISEIQELRNEMETVKVNNEGEKTVLWTCLAMISDLLDDYKAQTK